METLTSMLMMPTAVVGFVGTLWYGLVSFSLMTQMEAVGLVAVACVVALVAEFALAGISMFLNEVVLGV